VEVVFIAGVDPLAARLSAAQVPYRSLEFKRGREVALHPRRYAAHVGEAGPDGALLVARGLLAAMLRWGGYRGPIIGVEHGELLELPDFSWPRRLFLRVAGMCGARASDGEVGVSEFMLEEMRRHAHARNLRLIRNGIDPAVYGTREHAMLPNEQRLTLAFAGRLVPGKGADSLIRAVGLLAPTREVKALIAGEGPERSRLEALAESHGVAHAVSFLGRVDDMPAFWHASDIAIIPSDSFTESFSMVALEAMTCGKPIVATRNGAIPELVLDGVTGTLVDPGDPTAIADAVLRYAEHAELRRAHGAAARIRAIEQYHIDACARAYYDLFRELA
jgi:glycosyltransferase involved in cell wall biosynthesis